MQLDEVGRGFSFQADGPLDMRMSLKGPTAADIVNGASEEELARILYVLGEERRSRAVARAIVKARAEAPITTTRALADLVGRVLGPRKEDGKHPATRTFQALRIVVNRELENLRAFLEECPNLLIPGGRLCIISFHSLEDRIVKDYFRRWAKGEEGEMPSWRILTPKPVIPSEEETFSNPRARSAKLRVAEKTFTAENTENAERN